MPNRVLIADADTDMRQSLNLINEENLHLIVVGEASDSEELLAFITASHSDIVLIDWDFPETSV